MGNAVGSDRISSDIEDNDVGEEKNVEKDNPLGETERDTSVTFSREDVKEEDETGQGDTQPQFTQDQIDNIVLKQKSKLNSKLGEAAEATAQANTELELAKQQNKILEIALSQAKEGKGSGVVSAPNPNDFDDGAYDSEYRKKQNQYHQSIIEKEVSNQVSSATKKLNETQSINDQARQLERKQTIHYEQVKQSNIKDYFKHEDAAIGLLGNEVVNEVINNFTDESHLLLNYLGNPKNKAETEQLSNLLKTSPIKGVAKIGSILSSKLTVKSKSKSNAPDPDEVISGGAAPKRQRGPKGAKYS